MSKRRNYNLSCDDFDQIDAWAEGASDKYAVDLNGCWYKMEEGGEQ